jgi:uncharacterized membrane protein YuzA (DUF378 family)
MELMKKLEPFSLLVMVLGALDWGILGLFNTNVLSEIFGSGDALNVAYTVIGAAGLTWVPRMMDKLMHFDVHGIRPHGA